MMHRAKFPWLPLAALVWGGLTVQLAQANPPVARGSLAKAEVSSTLTSVEMARHATNLPVLELKGWKLPRPPYPYQARATHEQGYVCVQLTTDATGKVVRAVLPKDNPHPLLEQNTANYALANWHGPPSKTVTVTITYRLQ